MIEHIDVERITLYVDAKYIVKFEDGLHVFVDLIKYLSVRHTLIRLLTFASSHIS